MAEEAGARGFITKPVGREDLLAVIRRVLEGAP